MRPRSSRHRSSGTGHLGLYEVGHRVCTGQRPLDDDAPHGGGPMESSRLEPRQLGGQLQESWRRERLGQLVQRVSQARAAPCLRTSHYQDDLGPGGDPTAEEVGQGGRAQVVSGVDDEHPLARPAGRRLTASPAVTAVAIFFPGNGAVVVCGAKRGERPPTPGRKRGRAGYSHFHARRLPCGASGIDTSSLGQPWALGTTTTPSPPHVRLAAAAPTSLGQPRSASSRSARTGLTWAR